MEKLEIVFENIPPNCFKLGSCCIVLSSASKERARYLKKGEGKALFDVAITGLSSATPLDEELGGSVKGTGTLVVAACWPLHSRQ